MKNIISFFLTFCMFTTAVASQPNLKTENVIVVFKTHFDIGYTDLAGSVVNKYKSTMIEGALKVIDNALTLPGDEHFTWTLPAWPMQQILSGSSPEVKNRVVEALKNKYLAVHALPFTIETEASDLETLARAFQSSSDISREYGLELPRDSKMTDVPEHSWILPTILANAGIKFLHLGCNAASQSPEVPDLFWWEGPDGSRVLTMYSWKYYGTDVVPPDGWPYRSWIAIIHTNDNIGAPEPEVVEQTIEEIKRLNPNARVRQGRMSDFYDLVMKENTEIPVIRKDMPDTWIHGYMSMPEEIKTARAIKREIFTLDMLNSELNLWKSEKNDLSPIVKKAVENSLLFDEHTFGLAMSHGHSGIWSYGDQFKTMKSEEIYDPIEFSWKEKALRIIDAERVIHPELNDKMRELANSVNVKESHITVYNPLPWKRDGHVKLQIHTENLKNATALKDLATGEVIDLANKGNVVRFIARGVPAMGYKSYLPVEGKATPDNGLLLKKEKDIIENEYFRIRIDWARGGLGSIIDKKSGLEMVKPGSEYVFGGYVYERFSRENTESYAKDYIKGGWEWAPAELGRPNLSDENYIQLHPGPYRVEYEIDNIKVSAILQFKKDENNLHDYTLIYSLYRNLPYIEIQWGITGKSPDPWPEAGWISFPFNIEKPVFRLGRLGGIVDPTQDFIRNSNRDYCFVNTGIAVTGSDRGFGISSPDVPGISLDRPGLWKFTRNFNPSRPNVFYNLYNNQWSTNFTEWIEGSWSAKFYIWTVENYNNEMSVITPSEEFRVPMLADFAARGDGSLPVSAKGIELSMKGVLVTAFGRNPNGDGLILRLWEQAGNSGKCTVTLPEGLEGKIVIPVNLRGEVTGSPFEIKNNSISLEIKKYKPYSFMIL